METPIRAIPACAPRKSGLTRLQLVLLGKGPLVRTRPVSCAPWHGAALVREPFDADQAEENRLLYPHLFAPEVSR